MKEDTLIREKARRMKPAELLEEICRIHCALDGLLPGAKRERNRYNRRLRIIKAETRRRKITIPLPARLFPETAGFTLVELLLVIALIGILAGMLVPSIARAAHHATARAAWTNYWTQARAAAFAQDDLPESSAAYWLQTPDQAWARINGSRGITWSDVTAERIQIWRDSTRALATP